MRKFLAFRLIFLDSRLPSRWTLPAEALSLRRGNDAVADFAGKCAGFTNALDLLFGFPLSSAPYAVALCFSAGATRE
jgi:hypothetical protein